MGNGYGYNGIQNIALQDIHLDYYYTTYIKFRWVHKTKWILFWAQVYKAYFPYPRLLSGTKGAYLGQLTAGKYEKY